MFSEIEGLSERYPDIPIEAIIKEDMLRQGMAWSPEALEIAASYKPKAYFICSFDMVPISQMGQREHLKAPEEIRLTDGPFHVRPVIISVRLNPSSPYCVDSDEGRLILKAEGKEIAEVGLQKSPDYYQRTLSNGKPVADIAPTIEWGYLLYLAVFRLCQYFGAQEECQFCDINENYRQQKTSGRPYTSVKSVEEIIEALEIIASADSESRAYTITGGSITGFLEGKSEIDFYIRYPEAIEARWPGRWIGKIVVQALPKNEVQRLHDAGVQIYHPNFEIWDKRLFEQYCPGKARYVGRDEWVRRILDAASVFGPEGVIPNFVAGVEMAPPYGFRSIDEAIASTSEGLEFFMSRGVSPRFTTWCPEPMSVLGKDRRGAPLEYHVRLLRAYRDMRAKYKLPSPVGYGEPGIGRAVFSVSSFMDVLPPSEPGNAAA
jgi:hypothetical protein